MGDRNPFTNAVNDKRKHQMQTRLGAQLRKEPQPQSRATPKDPLTPVPAKATLPNIYQRLAQKAAHVEEESDAGPRAPQLAPKGRRCLHCWAEHVANSCEEHRRVAFFKRPFDKEVHTSKENGKRVFHEPMFEAQVQTDATPSDDVDVIASVLEIPLGITDTPEERARYKQYVSEMEQSFDWLSGFGERYGLSFSSQDLFVARHTYHAIMAYACENNDALQKELVGKAKSKTRWKKETDEAMNTTVHTLEWAHRDLERRPEQWCFADSACAFINGVPGTVACCQSTEHHERPRKNALWFWNKSKTGLQMLAEAKERLRRKGWRNFGTADVVREAQDYAQNGPLFQE